MKILVAGSGGREHAIIWKIRKDDPSVSIFCAPGNAGIAQEATCISIPAGDIPSLKNFAFENRIDLTIVGPEIPLAAGIVDEFRSVGLKIFGPTRSAAEIESSKVFSKDLMKKYQIPTARYEVYDSPHKAYQALQDFQAPYVVKADGLAAGKGVAICSTPKEAQTFINEVMTDKVFQEAGNRIVLEEFLEGFEVSVLALTDGKQFLVFPPAQDHKRVFDGDQGKNTGGMGAYAPTPMMDKHASQTIEQTIISPTVAALHSEGRPFTGLLYVGLMMTVKGPKVLEFNCRFGDPETQVILPLVKSNLLDLFFASIEGRINEIVLDLEKRCAVCVVLASGGYPDKFSKGKSIKGLESIDNQNVMVFHAGTKQMENQIVTDGGRVLGVTGFGIDITQAKNNAYQAIEGISFDHMHYRKDIAQRALTYLQETKL